MSVSPEEVAAAKTTVAPALAGGSVLGHMARAMAERELLHPLEGDVRQVPNDSAVMHQQIWTAQRDEAEAEGDHRTCARAAMRLDTYERLFVDTPNVRADADLAEFDLPGTEDAVALARVEADEQTRLQNIAFAHMGRDVESLLTQLDEAREKEAYLRAGVLDLTRDELVQRITAVDPAEWVAGAWLAEKLADARQDVASQVVDVVFAHGDSGRVNSREQTVECLCGAWLFVGPFSDPDAGYADPDAEEDARRRHLQEALAVVGPR